MGWQKAKCKSFTANKNKNKDIRKERKKSPGTFAQTQVVRFKTENQVSKGVLLAKFRYWIKT